MQPQSKNQRHQLALRTVNVTKLVSELMDSHSTSLAARDIRIEIDMQPFEARFDVELIRTAINGLIVNAIESSPPGGEISITSIDSPQQWEIEVADTSSSRVTADPATRIPDPSNEAQQADDSDELASVIPFPSNEHLRQAYRAAFAHEGQIQSWNCPLGGVAYVLVIPRRRVSKLAS